jgi:cyclopropane fatty-acyl-phospholipid synthase-like methyltransferase
MDRIAEQQAIKRVSQVSNVFFELGFDLQLLGSERYVRGKLESLSLAEVSKLKEAFIKNKHPFSKRVCSQSASTFWKNIRLC